MYIFRNWVMLEVFQMVEKSILRVPPKRILLKYIKFQYKKMLGSLLNWSLFLQWELSPSMTYSTICSFVSSVSHIHYNIFAESILVRVRRRFKVKWWITILLLHKRIYWGLIELFFLSFGIHEPPLQWWRCSCLNDAIVPMW